jgi:hypothetical protein
MVRCIPVCSKQLVRRSCHVIQASCERVQPPTIACSPGGWQVDREGRPVLVYKFGAVDLEVLNRVTTPGRLTQYHIQAGQGALEGC